MDFSKKWPKNHPKFLLHFLIHIDITIHFSLSLSHTVLRLQLLSPNQYPNLVQTMYGLLMLLPQTNAFESLNGRLSSVPILTTLSENKKK